VRGDVRRAQRDRKDVIRMTGAQPTRRRARLVGVGLDHGDGHTRFTCGHGFRLLYGSAATHAKMEAKALEFMRRVREQGLSMDRITREECCRIAEQIGLHLEEIGVG